MSANRYRPPCPLPGPLPRPVWAGRGERSGPAGIRDFGYDHGEIASPPSSGKVRTYPVPGGTSWFCRTCACRSSSCARSRLAPRKADAQGCVYPACDRGGSTTVLIAKENAKDLVEIPNTVRGPLKTIPISRVDGPRPFAGEEARADRAGTVGARPAAGPVKKVLDADLVRTIAVLEPRAVGCEGRHPPSPRRWRPRNQTVDGELASYRMGPPLMVTPCGTSYSILGSIFDPRITHVRQSMLHAIDNGRASTYMLFA